MTVRSWCLIPWLPRPWSGIPQKLVFAPFPRTSLWCFWFPSGDFRANVPLIGCLPFLVSYPHSQWFLYLPNEVLALTFLTRGFLLMMSHLIHTTILEGRKLACNGMRVPYSLLPSHVSQEQQLAHYRCSTNKGRNGCSCKELNQLSLREPGLNVWSFHSKHSALAITPPGSYY